MNPFRAHRLRRSLATLCLILAGRLTPNFAGAKPAGRLSPARVPHPGTSRNGAKTRLRPAGTVFPVGASYCVLRPPLACKGANLIVSSRASYRLACSQPVCQAARYNPTTQTPVSHHSVRTWVLRLPPGNSAIRRCVDRSLPRRQQSSVSSTNVTVTSRHLLVQQLSFKAARPKGLPAIRTAKSGSRDAPYGAELDLLAQIHVQVR